MNTVYRRTAKGEEEIKKRTYKLDHSHRFVLIMVDGKADVANIISRSSKQWMPKQSLYEMEINGFIQNINSQKSNAQGLSKLKLALIIHTQKLLPNNYKKVVNKIINADMTKESLGKAIDSSSMFVKLTISEDISNALKTQLHSILNKSTEL